MIKRMLIMLVLVAVVLGGVFGFKDFVNGKIKEFMTGPAGPGRQAAIVSTTKAVTTDWQSQIEAVGSLRAVNGADLSLELAGVVETLNFQSGDDVGAGKVLLKLRDFDDVAKLKSLEAQADLAKITYDRDVKQLNAKAIAQAVVDNDEANLRNLRAQVDQQRALVEKKTLAAPFAGHLGIRQVDLGQYLAAGTLIVTLQALTPIYVDFLLPQKALSQLRIDQPLKVRVDTFADQMFTGKITSINSKVDPTTRNIQVRATLDNNDHKLLPGMFATVAIDSGAPQKLITVPQTAITYNPYGNLVYVVDSKGNGADGKGNGADGKPQLTVRQTFVTTGATRGDQVSVLKGIKEGDEIVTAGQMKLRNGVSIVVNNTVSPSNDVNPKPLDN
jgi:membrane fusion protein (multidrug efflux system)